jgi:S-adenosylmethionine hydrolase
LNLEIEGLYIHINKGSIYKLKMLTNMNSRNNNFKPTVVYEDKFGEIWSRPMNEFIVKFKAADELDKALKNFAVAIGITLEKFFSLGEIFATFNSSLDPEAMKEINSQLDLIAINPPIKEQCAYRQFEKRDKRKNFRR